MNKRLYEINKFINDNNINNDNINEIINKYKEELNNYKYIDNLIDFSLLKLKGSIKYINKYDNELKYGGLLIKIYEKNGNYFAMVKKMNGKIYHVSYNNNFIFYMKNSNESFRDSLSLFISEYDKGLYNIN